MKPWLVDVLIAGKVPLVLFAYGTTETQVRSAVQALLGDLKPYVSASVEVGDLGEYIP